tara:strand:- start:123 stop:323 length:201 start_codon:yes stop_codon:yes gene_type:complete
MDYHYIKPEQYIQLYVELAEHSSKTDWASEEFVAECDAIEAILYSNGIVIEDQNDNIYTRHRNRQS